LAFHNLRKRQKLGLDVNIEDSFIAKEDTGEAKNIETI
jgi:hypothetical protein